DAAGDGEEDALGERLRDDLAARGAEGEPDGSLPATRDPAGEQQVRHVGAGDEHHETADGEKDLQTPAVLLFHHGDTRSRGTTLRTCLGRTRITSGSQFGGYPESCSSHCRSTPVRRGPMPSTEAPGRTRPIMRSHAETGWRSRLPSPLMMGSCPSGI